jgi:hypothetical protein
LEKSIEYERESAHVITAAQCTFINAIIIQRQPTMLVGGIGLALRFGSGRVVIFDEKTVISH